MTYLFQLKRDARGARSPMRATVLIVYLRFFIKTLAYKLFVSLYVAYHLFVYSFTLQMFEKYCCLVTPE
jgi:hypothetical protein